jgi:hypothetical protein
MENTFAGTGKPEMSRLNNSGMNWTHRHFVNISARNAEKIRDSNW